MGMNDSVTVVPTGTANLASVFSILERLGEQVHVSGDPGDVESADRLVLPGVGTLAAAMERLEKLGLVDVIRRRIEEGRPTLAICLGLQVLCEGSEENPGLLGIGAVDGRITKFGEGVRIPQLGWNYVSPGEECSMVEPGYYYFANSYRLERSPEDWCEATCDYGGQFVAAMEKGRILACQFHPELSGQLGINLIERWLKAAEGKGASC